MFDSFTEFDEEATSKPKAIANLIYMQRLFLAGDETMGVVQGCENAARGIGVTEAEIDACYVEAKKPNIPQLHSIF